MSLKQAGQGSTPCGHTMKKQEHICEDCGAVHIYYWKPQAKCVRIIKIIDYQEVITCGGKLIKPDKKKVRRCGKCGKVGHNKRTCNIHTPS